MKLENSIIPVHKQTENLQRLQENVEKTLSCLDHVISYYHVAKDTEKIIKEGWVQQLDLSGELHPIDLLGQKEVGADSAHLKCSLYPSHVIPSHQSSRKLPDLNISNPQRAKSAQALHWCLSQILLAFCHMKLAGGFSSLLFPQEFFLPWQELHSCGKKCSQNRIHDLLLPREREIRIFCIILIWSLAWCLLDIFFLWFWGTAFYFCFYF